MIRKPLNDELELASATINKAQVQQAVEKMALLDDEVWCFQTKVILEEFPEVEELELEDLEPALKALKDEVSWLDLTSISIWNRLQASKE